MKNRNVATGDIEVPIPEFYPRLCVVYEKDIEKAKALTEEFLASESRPLGDDWQCDACGEKVPDSMVECWSCQKPRC